MRFVVCLLALVPTYADADCAMMGLAPKVLTQPDTVLAPDGGIVVAAVSVERGSLEDGDHAVQSKWKLVAPKAAIVPTIDKLAPGLAVYSSKNADAFELHDDNNTALVKATRSTIARGKLDAPKVKTIKYDAPLSRRMVKRIEVVLDGPKPPGVIALVLADAKGKPKSWGLAEGAVFYPYLQRDCLTLPNGTQPSAKGDKVTLFWVDESGRKSAFTKPMTIK